MKDLSVQKLPTTTVKPLILAGIGGAVAVAIGVTLLLSSMQSTPTQDSTSNLQQPQQSDNPSLPQTQIPADPSNEDTTSELADEGDGESTNFEEDDNPIIIEDEQFDPDSSSSSSGSGQASAAAVVYQRYVEPREQAFSMLIPAGWTPTANVALSISGGLKVHFLAENPDRFKSIGFQKPTAASYFMPSGYFTEEGLTSHEGAIAYYYYRTADQYVQDILLPQLASALSTNVQLEGQMPLGSGQGFTAGFYQFSYQTGGTDSVMQMIVTTYAGSFTPSGEIYSWDADLNAITAPRNEINEFAEQGWTSLASMGANPAFVQKYIQGAGAASGTFSTNSDVFFDTLHSIQRSQSGLDSTFQGFSDATLGTQNAVDANGNTYTVPLSHNNWFVGSTTGYLYGSNTGNVLSENENLIPLQLAN